MVKIMSTMEDQQVVPSQNMDFNDYEDEEEVTIIENSIEPYYSSLLSMFPNVDSGYIREICINPPFDESNDVDLLQMFVNHLLSYDDQIDENVAESYNRFSSMQNFDVEARTSDEFLTQMLQQQDQQMMELDRQNEEKTNDLLFSEFLKQDQDKVDEKMNILENILPDADPEYLRKFVQDNHENAMSLGQFVESSLANKNYGKRDKYYAKMKIKERVEQYTTGFSVEEFVKEFPEPFEHFENVEKQGVFQEQAFSFLKSRYSNYPEQYLANVYSANKYNLSLADKQIQLVAGSDDEILMLLNVEVDNTALLQEIAFIQNKPLIKLHLDHMKSEEEKELEVLRANKLLLECQCCYDELKPTECIECDNSHIFCKRCVIKGTNLVISSGQTSVRCFVGCDKEISLNVLRKVLPECTFEMLLKKCQEAEVEAAQLDGLVTCPFCPYQMELTPEIKIFTCRNPECMKITCRLCRKINHLPIKCEDVLDEHKGRLYIEEEMSKGLIRKCYKCQRPFVKNTGCNSVSCVCGATMCYICMQPFRQGYSHRNCSRHSGKTFDRQQVESKREEATAKLRNDFPDMNIPKV